MTKNEDLFIEIVINLFPRKKFQKLYPIMLFFLLL